MKQIVVLLLALPFVALASTPRMVTEMAVLVSNPSMEQVYHDVLVGEARAYRMEMADTWELSLRLLVPKSTNPKGRFDAVVVSESNGTVASILEAGSTPWVEYRDKMSGLEYLAGPLLRQELPAGNYRIVVTSNGNVGQYALAIGEKSDFSISEIVSEIRLLPDLQKTYFKGTQVGLLTSPLMLTYVAVMLFLGALVGVYVRRHQPKVHFFHLPMQKHFAGKNLDILGRVVRLLGGKICFVLAIYISWNPALFLIAGFSLYQALSGWCVFFAFTGRSSCE